MTAEKKVSYTTTNTYDTLNTFSPKTKNVWLVFHGMGYLSRYFIHHFAQLDAAKNFIKKEFLIIQKQLMDCDRFYGGSLRK